MSFYVCFYSACIYQVFSCVYYIMLEKSICAIGKINKDFFTSGSFSNVTAADENSAYLQMKLV